MKTDRCTQDHRRNTNTLSLRSPAIDPPASPCTYPTQLRTQGVFFIPIVPVLNSSPTPTPIALARDLATDPPAQAAVFFLSSQPFHLLPTCTAVVHTLAPDKRPGFARVDAVADLAFPIEVGQRDVEAVDVGWYHGQEEHDTVEDEVFVGPSDEEDGQRRKEDVEGGDDQTFE